MEAGGLQERQDEFIDETGLEFGFLFALYEGGSGAPATADDVEGYAQTIGDPSFPVMADGSGMIQHVTPMTQQVHPEMCALTPDFEVISCYNGHGAQEYALDDIEDHAGL